MTERSAAQVRAALSDGELEQLECLTEELRKSPHNLMSSRALEELWTRHIPECIALGERLPAVTSRAADVGSGGGLPGLVIAVVRPDLDMTLIESTKKKARFLESTARLMGLASVRVVGDRVEHLHDSTFAGHFEAVTARAVARLEELIPWTLPLLRRDGRLYAVKGEHWQEDLERARRALGPDAFVVLDRPADQRPAGSVEPRVVVIGRR